MAELGIHHLESMVDTIHGILGSFPFLLPCLVVKVSLLTHPTSYHSLIPKLYSIVLTLLFLQFFGYILECIIWYQTKYASKIKQYRNENIRKVVEEMWINSRQNLTHLLMACKDNCDSIITMHDKWISYYMSLKECRKHPQIHNKKMIQLISNLQKLQLKHHLAKSLHQPPIEITKPITYK